MGALKTIPGLMRQVAAGAVVAAVVAMSAFGCNGEDDNNTKSPDTGGGNAWLPVTGGCTFNSKLSLKVYVVREAGGIEEQIGRTPSAKPSHSSGWVGRSTFVACPVFGPELRRRALPGGQVQSRRDKLSISKGQVSN